MVVLCLYPEFPEALMPSVSSCGEFVFVIDRSTSMGPWMNHESGAQSIESAKVRLNTKLYCDFSKA